TFCPLPYIGIETSWEEKLNEILIDLGYSMEDTRSKTIYEILKDKGISPDSNKKGL
ncbi:MAG: adenylate cyclase, partial [Clostridium perfringens]|nr:adenylate cyclase [Clostridium perfringens]